MTDIHIRDVTPADFPKIVELNREFVHFTSEMDEQRLAELHKASSYHRVVEAEGEVLAFLLVMGDGSDYDSVNYRWFDTRYENYYYVDRIVTAGTSHRKGLGKMLYDDLFQQAEKSGVQRLCCEYNTLPANPVSAAFHHKYGFSEVGSQVIVEGKKVVSMQVVEL